MRALAVASRWPRALRLSLNVSAADLAEANFAHTILAALAVADFEPERLTLEITEQALVAELDRSGEQLERLASRGIRIALDDFGAGFCNFHYLKRLPLQVLKLDRSMIHGVVEDARDLAILRAIVAMARALGLAVVAEGVETEAQRAAIVREGCQKWQGFLGGAPMAAEEFAAFTAR
jgi:EAL domain-containing protein (putative c-di-GMP-specific phosphodiesterase class I)